MKLIARIVRKLILRLSAAVLLLLLTAAGFFSVRGYNLYREAVDEKSLEARVEEICGMENFTAYSELPSFYRKAVVSVEDHRFEDHCGIDLIAIGRAAWNDIRAMSFVEGGSTITQQLAKNMLFTQEKKLERKAAEIFAALKLEADYTKEEIFELYVNTIYFGSGYYGIYQASRGYFEKDPSELTDYECAMLAGIPNAPSAYSPDVDEKLASQRVGQVLDSMVRHKIITREEADRIEADSEGKAVDQIEAENAERQRAKGKLIKKKRVRTAPSLLFISDFPHLPARVPAQGFPHSRFPLRREEHSSPPLGRRDHTVY